MTCMNPHRSYDNWKSTAITTTLVCCKPICSQLHCAFFSSPAFLLQYQKTPRGPPASSRTCRMEGGKERGGEGKDRANGLKQVQSTGTLNCCSHQSQDSPPSLTGSCLANFPATLAESLIAADAVHPCSLVLHITCTPAHMSRSLHSLPPHMSALARTPQTYSHVCTCEGTTNILTCLRWPAVSHIVSTHTHI